VAKCPRKESKQALAPGGRKGDSYFIGSLPASRAVSRIARIRHSAAPLRSLSPPCAQALMQLPT